MPADEKRMYVAFFKATLPFFNSYEELLTLWKEQEDNRRTLGLSAEQEKYMRLACMDRKKKIDSIVVEEYIPQRPNKS